jgi:hypothetical protein
LRATKEASSIALTSIVVNFFKWMGAINWAVTFTSVKIVEPWVLASNHGIGLTEIVTFTGVKINGLKLVSTILITD